MTPRPRPYHRAEAERLLDYADEWAAQAGELSPEASELSCLAYAAVHALLAIHDTLTAADRYAANEARQREELLEDAWQFRDWELVSRLLDEAAQRAAVEPDPLDENDHRDRLDGNGLRLRRKSSGYWVWAGAEEVGGWTLDDIHRLQGPLTFAPEPPPDAARDDLTASEGENGSMEGADADNAQNAILRPEPLWCPECGHHIDDHHDGSCLTLCECRALPSVIARALIERAANIERTRLTAQLRLTTSSAQDSGDLAELDALADEWEAR